MAHNHEDEIDYESLPAGSSMAINMFAGAMVSRSSFGLVGRVLSGMAGVRGLEVEMRCCEGESRRREFRLRNFDRRAGWKGVNVAGMKMHDRTAL
jgi:hypothetical protein